MADNYYGLTDTGKQRKNNEDAFIAEPSGNNRYTIACVIDGVGGYSGGEVAAALARESILQRLAKISGQVIPLITDAFNIANEKIWDEKARVKEHDSMACVATLAVVDLETNLFYFAHVGDTRLYLIRDRSLIKISHDQSFVGFLEDSGRLTEKEAMNHPKRNEIDKALGFKNIDSKIADYIETGQSPFLPGDMLLLCSDGLTDLVDKETITQIVTTGSSLKAKCSSLIDAANENGGKDNITVVLVENNKAPKQHDATRPIENMELKNEKTARHHPEKATESEAIPEKASSTLNKALVGFLVLLVVGLAAVCLWLYFNPKTQQVTVIVPPQPVTHTPNAQELKLQYAINTCTSKYLVLYDTAFTSPVIITQPLVINQDTLHIKTKGNIVLQSDTSYEGAAITVSANSKHVALDSLFFKHFNTAIIAYNNAIELNNVRFSDCKFQLQNFFSFADGKYVSGSLASKVFAADSLPKTKLTYGAR
jgi:serine/threonine protein phosphatase PrpC